MILSKNTTLLSISPFVDSEGNIVTCAVGMIDGETLEKGIKNSAYELCS